MATGNLNKREELVTNTTLCKHVFRAKNWYFLTPSHPYNCLRNVLMVPNMKSELIFKGWSKKMSFSTPPILNFSDWSLKYFSSFAAVKIGKKSVHHHLLTSLYLASIYSTHLRTNPWKFQEKILTIGVVEKLSFF